MLVRKTPKLIKVKEAAEILGLAANTVHNRKGGTAKLNRIYQGRAVRLIESEVLEHLENLIKKTGKPNK